MMLHGHTVWLIERFSLVTGNSDEVYVAGLLNGARYYDTTGNANGAKQFRWRWQAQLWMWLHPDEWMPHWQYPCEWRVSRHMYLFEW